MHEVARVMRHYDGWLCRPTQDQLLIDWTATINELQSPTSQTSHVTSPDTISLGDVTGPTSDYFFAHIYTHNTHGLNHINSLKLSYLL